MPAQEATPGRRVSRVFRASAVILGQKEIPVVKGRKEMWGLRDRQGQRGRPDLLDHREISDFRDPEAFQAQQAQRDRQVLWDHKV